MADRTLEVSHPIIDVLDVNTDALAAVVEAVEATSWGSDEETHLIRTRMGFLADGLVEVGNFTLEPTELVETWGKVLDGCPNRHMRYRVAAMVSGAFAVQSVDDVAWKRFPRDYLEQARVPDALKNTDKITMVKGRLAIVNGNVATAFAAEQSRVSEQLYENFGNGLGSMLARLSRC
jgi:hypothetical protein